jgi:hypothetical protein
MPATPDPATVLGAAQKTNAEQQHTGAHERPERERQGNERLGGTRAGAENVEPKK